MFPRGSLARIVSDSKHPKPDAEDGVELIELDTGKHFIKNGVWKEQLQSVPPSGMHRVTNIYWDPTLSKIAVEFDTTPSP